MKTRVLFLCLTLIFSSIQVFAQLSKKEKREWKKKAKKLAKNPANLKNLMESKQEVENNNNALKQQVDSLINDAKAKTAKIVGLEDEISKMTSELTSTKAELAQLKEAPSVNSLGFSKGLVFKVQIGAYKNKDLSKYFDNNPNFGGEATDNGAQRFTIGVFRNYWESNKFKKYMREMGVKDAWIVPYKDGRRVELKEVLDGLDADKK